MAVIRVNHTANYTVMSNFHLRDNELSLRAKGLLSLMLSLPPDWDYTVAGLVSISKESQSAVTSALKELRNCGYLVITKKLPNETESGRIEYIYDIYEEKQEGKKQGIEKQGLVFQGVEKQGVEIQGIENQAQINNNKQSKEKQSKEKQNTDIKPFGSDAMNNVFAEWLAYKREKRQEYKQTGLKQLINRLQDEIKTRGENAVITGIQNSMAQGWSGIYFHEDTKKPKMDLYAPASPPSYDLERAERKMKTTIPKLRKKGER